MTFDVSRISSGDTAWVLAASALVMMMVPGVALFYAGMVRAKGVLSIILQGFVTLSLAGVTWALVAFSLAFGRGNGFVGDLHFAVLGHMDQILPGFTGAEALTVPPLLFAVFQMMFAAVTPALIIGATADRWRLTSFAVFVVVWSVIVYAPVAHWLFDPLGWAARSGALDFAGGLVVHTNAGAAGLAMALVLKRRRGWPEEPMRPHNLPLMLTGATMLWFGWFGFNAGSALHAGTLAAYAFVNTTLAGSAGLLTWMAVERVRFGKPTTLGAASGMVSGLVAITPASGFVAPGCSLLIGTAAGAGCALAVSVKGWLGLDDSLDVVGVHLVGGLIGTLSVGLFATTTVNAHGADGLFYGGGYTLLGHQTVAAVTVICYSFAATWILAKALDRLVGNRVSAREEQRGLDLTLHGETAYHADPVPAAAPGAPAGVGGRHG
ncbi:ammonium transporter [Streptomyces sp. NPDC005122]